MLNINHIHHIVLKFVSYENTEDPRTSGWTQGLSRGNEGALDRRAAVLVTIRSSPPGISWSPLCLTTRPGRSGKKVKIRWSGPARPVQFMSQCGPAGVHNIVNGSGLYRLSQDLCRPIGLVSPSMDSLFQFQEMPQNGGQRAVEVSSSFC